MLLQLPLLIAAQALADQVIENALRVDGIVLGKLRRLLRHQPSDDALGIDRSQRVGERHYPFSAICSAA